MTCEQDDPHGVNWIRPTCGISDEACDEEAPRVAGAPTDELRKIAQELVCELESCPPSTWRRRRIFDELPWSAVAILDQRPCMCACCWNGLPYSRRTVQPATMPHMMPAQPAALRAAAQRLSATTDMQLPLFVFPRVAPAVLTAPLVSSGLGEGAKHAR